MNGNTPYAGAPGVVDAGQSTAEPPSGDEIRQLREAVAGIVDRTEAHLPDDYVVGAELSQGAGGVEVTVAVQPPAGNPVSAGLSGDRIDVSDGERDEVARGLAASAAFQAMRATEGVTPTAR